MIVPRVFRLATLSLLSFVGAASGYDIETHRELGLRSASSSSNVRSVLGDDLGCDRAGRRNRLGNLGARIRPRNSRSVRVVRIYTRILWSPPVITV